MATLESDPQLLSVSPQHFAEHLEVLRRRFPPMRLLGVVDGESTIRSQRLNTVITFDDGYADNLHAAAPLLHAADCPATIFVTAGRLDTNQEFWWDEVERLILRPPVLPNQLSLTVGGRDYNWSIADAAQSIDSQWNVLLAPRSPRQTLYSELTFLLRGLDAAERELIIGRLQRWANCNPTGRASHRSLTNNELRALAADGLVEVGAHTVSHPSLAKLPPPSQRSEIFCSKAALENVLDRPVRSFSYPFGSRGDFQIQTSRLVQEAGFDLACANFAGLVTSNTDRYQLPRMLVRNWNGDEFENRLEAAVAA